jgi:D-alanine--poly(phosphoribitol) ligase subunit 2
MQLADRVIAVLAEVTESDDVLENQDIRLYDEHLLDSLKTVELILAFAETFGVEVPLAAFEPEEWATPRQIVRYIERAVAG